MKNKKKHIFFLIICFLNSTAIPLYSQDNKPMTSISDDELFSLTHYYRFYGDVNTIYGSFFKRSFAFGGMSGLRDQLVNHGIYLDASVDLFYGFNTTGGANQDILRHDTVAEYWFVFDTTQNNLWPNGAFMIQALSSWEFSVNDDTGALIPANGSAIKPTHGKSKSILAEVVFAQEIGNFTLRVGKLDATGPLDDNNFANNSRFQFLNNGLVNNPIIIHFIPDNLLSLYGDWTASDLHTVKMFIGSLTQPDNKSDLKNVFNGHNTYCFQYQCTPNIAHTLPGNYRIIICAANKCISDYTINERAFSCPTHANTNIPIPSQTINYALLLNADQYIWVDSIANSAIKRQGQEPIGIGIFARAGWAPQDRNTIAAFYSFGIGGYGMPGTKRYYDFWGLGYTATKVSEDVRNDLLEQNIKFNAFEQAFEAFYNFALGQWAHIQFDAQLIKPPLKTRSTAFVLQTRLRFDF